MRNENAEKLTTELCLNILTESIKPVYHKAEMIAQTDKVTVLIIGETGTGKEHLARFLHDNSIRKTNPYVAINCSAFSD